MLTRWTQDREFKRTIIYVKAFKESKQDKNKQLNELKKDGNKLLSKAKETTNMHINEMMMTSWDLKIEFTNEIEIIRETRWKTQ